MRSTRSSKENCLSRRKDLEYVTDFLQQAHAAMSGTASATASISALCDQAQSLATGGSMKKQASKLVARNVGRRL